MDRISELEAFVQTVDLGSQAAAAEALGLTRMAISRLLRDLETRIGEPLLHRTTRRQTLTEAGAQFLQKIRPILDDYAKVTSKSDEAGLRGKLRVSAPVSFGSRCLLPLLSAFSALHPGIDFDVVLNDRQVDLVDEGFDLAIRIAGQGASGLVTKRLATSQTVICAAPAYIAARGMPREPDELNFHNCLRYAYATHGDGWALTSAEGIEHRIHPQGNLTCNNGDALLAAALAGQGIIQQPFFIVSDEIRAGRLVRLLPKFATRQLAISAVYLPAPRPQANILSLIDFLAPAYVQSDL